MGTKLELTWVGKEDSLAVEPRILLYDEEKSYGEQDTENMLIHGDNLLALKALEEKYSGQVKCIYIDPPYNIGAAVEHYDDNMENSLWLKLMKARLEILRNLLSPEGTIWIQIDDDQQAYLKVICDEVFRRKNFINMISVNMKNTAGASGGGQDKKIKKNCEYILVYAKDYEFMPQFNGTYVYTEISDLIEQYKDENKSWKYTTVLVDAGEKEYIGSTADGDNNEIKVYRRKNISMMSIKQVAKNDGIREKEAYTKYGIKVFQTTNAQSSIRPRVIKFKEDFSVDDDVVSIEYIPKTGKNKGIVYEQFYKGDKCRLFVWLKDTAEIIDGQLFKKDLQGTYWDMNAWMKNVTKEGGVSFPKSKKPEQLVSRVLSMASEEGDLVFDSFLGSGTTAAVAHKMKRRWIGIEMGDHAYTHCKARLDKVVAGSDSTGVTKDMKWEGGGGYKFYELAATLINFDSFGEPIINKEYSPEMLATTVALHEGFDYQPDQDIFWKQSQSTEGSFLFVTTKHLDKNFLDSIFQAMGEKEFLTIACKSYDDEIKNCYGNISIKKIPQMLLSRCEYDVDNYNFKIVEPQIIDGEEESDE